MNITPSSCICGVLVPRSNDNYLSRIQSIDLLRGLLIILMALDHVRDFFGLTSYRPDDLLYTTPAVFMTRWITSVCAPTFIFLSGLSAYLYCSKTSPRQATVFLLKRGIFFVLLEIFLSFAGKPLGPPILILQVIWVIGVSMIMLAGLLWLPRRLLLFFAMTVIATHNFLDPVTVDASSWSSMLWHLLHCPVVMAAPGFTLFISYPLIPWFAVMMLGYGLGPWMQTPLAQRNKNFMLLGAAFLLAFVVLRFLNGYGDVVHWQTQSRGGIYTLLSFIKVTKYPPSLLFILITLGTVTLLWPLWEYWRGATSRFVLTFGKVAIFFYLIHLFIIITASNLLAKVFMHPTGGWWSPQEKTFSPLYHFSLLRVYLLWMVLLAITYPLCLWYKQYKATHNYWWLKYF